MKKKSNPGLLTYTVSGHLESGTSYRETAIKETKEEAGITIDPTNLTDLGARYYPSGNGMRWAGRFIYKYSDGIEKLQIEEDEGEGFELISIQALKRLFDETPEQFTPFLTNEFGREMLEEAERHLTN